MNNIMSHYDEFYEDDNHVKRSKDKAEYYEYVKKFLDSESTNVLGDEFPLPEDEDRRQRENYNSSMHNIIFNKNTETVLKNKKGKPKDARYCFLDCFEERLDLGSLIEQLVFKIDSKQPQQNIEHHLSVMEYQLSENSIDKEILINDLILLRSQALESGKYRVDGYKQPIDLAFLLDALARHYIKYALGDHIDEESGYHHLSHVLANILLIRYQVRSYYNKN